MMKLNDLLMKMIYYFLKHQLKQVIMLKMHLLKQQEKSIKIFKMVHLI